MTSLHKERHMDLSLYRPLPEDEESLTPRQIQERRAATRRVSFLRYATSMTRQSAEAVIALPADELMRRLEIDKDQAVDLQALAERHLELCEMAGVR